jgi:hypothetical protein
MSWIRPVPATAATADREATGGHPGEPGHDGRAGLRADPPGDCMQQRRPSGHRRPVRQRRPVLGTVIDCARPGGVAYSGFEAFHNTGGTATTERVTLVHPRNLQLVAAWVVPITGTDLIGVGSGYPSASDLASTAPGAQWGQRQRVSSAVVRHTRGHDLIDLVVVVKPSGKVGTAKAINLYYQADGTHYLLHVPYGLKISVNRTC